jgi:hypothetical protein
MQRSDQYVVGEGSHTHHSARLWALTDLDMDLDRMGHIVR